MNAKQNCRPRSIEAVLHCSRLIGARLRRVQRGAKVGPEFLLLGLIAWLDVARSKPLMLRLGVRHPERVIKRIKKLAVANDQACRVLPTQRLEQLLERVGELLDGDQADIERVFLELAECEAARWLLHDTVDFIDSYQDAASRPIHRSELVRELTRHYGHRLQVGRRLFDARTGRDGTAEFARPGAWQAWEAKSALQRQSCEAEAKVFQQLAYWRSPLGRCWREHGEVAAHLVGATLLAEIGVIHDGPPTVRELAAVLSIKHFHRNLHLAQQTVSQLRRRWLTVPCSQQNLYLGMPVLPHSRVLEEFLAYLRYEPITNEDVQDMLASLG